MNLVVLAEVAQKYGRHVVFFRTAARLGMIHTIKRMPYTVIEEDLERFVRNLSAEQVTKVNAVLNRARNAKKSPPLADRRKPGSKPGSGFVSQLKERSDSMTAAGGGGTTPGNLNEGRPA